MYHHVNLNEAINPEKGVPTSTGRWLEGNYLVNDRISRKYTNSSSVHVREPVSEVVRT